MNRNTAKLWLGIIRVLMIAAIPTQSFAQAVESLTVGTRVRVRTVTPNQSRVGYIRSVDSSAISASTTSADRNSATAGEAAYLWTVPLSSVRSVEVSRGPGARAGRTIVGALLGSIGGGLILGTVGYFVTRCDCSESGIGILAGPIFGVPIGFVLGGITGFATPRERWEPVSVRGSVAPRVQ